MADIQVFADCGDFTGGKDLGTRRELMRASGDFPGCMIRALPHAGEEVVEAEIRDFVFLGIGRFDLFGEGSELVALGFAQVGGVGFFEEQEEAKNGAPPGKTIRW